LFTTAREGWCLKNAREIFVYGGPRRLVPEKFSQNFCLRRPEEVGA
jgi:hypothetical protein